MAEESRTEPIVDGPESHVEASAATPSLADRFDLLSDHRRRIALGLLLGRDEAMSLADLARVVSAHENGQADEQAVRSVYLSLTTSTFPNLLTRGSSNSTRSGRR